MKTSERVFTNVTEQRHRTMSHIHGKDTKPEIMLRKALWHKGYRYRKNCKGLPGRPDIFLLKYSIAIFVDSEFFHGKNWDDGLKDKLMTGNNAAYWLKKIPENMERDLCKDAELRGKGITMLHFWSRDVEKRLDDCIKVIEDTIFELKVSSDADDI